MPPKTTSKISSKEFEKSCKMGQRYEGYVEGLGYVFWTPLHVNLSKSAMPSQTPYNTPRGSQFTTTIYRLTVVKEEKNENTGNEILQNIAKLGVDVLSIYGVAASAAAMSTKSVTLGSKYKQINPQGTVIHNPYRRTVTLRSMATKVGNRIVVAGIIVDWSLVAMKEQTWKDAMVNTAVNAGIWGIGIKCLPAAIALGIAWFIISKSSCSPSIRPISNEEAHGLMPIDNTRVVTRYHLVKKAMEIDYEQKQSYFRQGR